MNRVLASLFLSLCITSSFAMADDTSPEGEQCTGKYCDKAYALELVPKAYFLKDQPAAGSFAVNGYKVPSKTQSGGDIRIYGIHSNGVQGGLSFSGLMFSDDSIGTSISRYKQTYGGIWLAKNFEVATNLDVTLGSVFGIGIANLEVLGTTINGRIREFAVVVEPTVSVGYRLCKSIKVGAVGSYLLPFLKSDDIKGSDLGARNISAQGFSAGIQVAFGRFEPLVPAK